MVFQTLPAVETGRARLLDDGFKVPVVGVAQHPGEIPAGPEFVAGWIGAADSLKRGDVVAHSL
jgi:hypothetical protein